MGGAHSGGYGYLHEYSPGPIAQNPAHLEAQEKYCRLVAEKQIAESYLPSKEMQSAKDASKRKLWSLVAGFFWLLFLIWLAFYLFRPAVENYLKINVYKSSELG
jgi:hypothetical protein